jgi:CheY-like chemotaxis protein
VTPKLRGIVQRQVHHITRLVDDLLDVARFTAGKLELRREPVTLDQIVEEAVTSCRSASEAHGHTLMVHAPNSAATVNGDPVRLVQVVVNLLSNAIKYTPQNGKIDVTFGLDAGQAFVRIVDNGRGIPGELLPRIFDMFVQERATADGAGGLGLGLGLAKRLVELHQGTMLAESAGSGHGSMFEVRLPLADPDQTMRWSGPRDTSRDRPLHAVVVDDAPDLRELVADLLRSRGHAVTTVEDGPQAIEVICAVKPDVALIDIGLPDMDGYEVARAVRRSLPANQLRLIAMTGYGQASDRATAFDAGFDAHIVKPASADKILRALYGKPEET